MPGRKGNEQEERQNGGENTGEQKSKKAVKKAQIWPGFCGRVWASGLKRNPDQAAAGPSARACVRRLGLASFARCERTCVHERGLDGWMGSSLHLTLFGASVGVFWKRAVLRIVWFFKTAEIFLVLSFFLFLFGGFSKIHATPLQDTSGRKKGSSSYACLSLAPGLLRPYSSSAVQ
jgi:hypothetical protein